MVSLSKDSWELVFRPLLSQTGVQRKVTRRLEPSTKKVKLELGLQKRRSGPGEEIGGQHVLGLGASLTEVDSLCDRLAGEG